MSTQNVYKQIRRFRKVLNLFKELIFGNKNGKNLVQLELTLTPYSCTNKRYGMVKG